MLKYIPNLTAMSYKFENPIDFTNHNIIFLGCRTKYSHNQFGIKKSDRIPKKAWIYFDA